MKHFAEDEKEGLKSDLKVTDSPTPELIVDEQNTKPLSLAAASSIAGGDSNTVDTHATVLKNIGKDKDKEKGHAKGRKDLRWLYMLGALALGYILVPGFTVFPIFVLFYACIIFARQWQSLAARMSTLDGQDASKTKEIFWLSLNPLALVMTVVSILPLILLTGLSHLSSLSIIAIIFGIFTATQALVHYGFMLIYPIKMAFALHHKEKEQLERHKDTVENSKPEQKIKHFLPVMVGGFWVGELLLILSFALSTMSTWGFSTAAITILLQIWLFSTVGKIIKAFENGERPGDPFSALRNGPFTALKESFGYNSAQPQDTVIEYKPLAASERWLKQRFSHSSPWKAVVLALMVILILLMDPGEMVKDLLLFIAETFGNGGGGGSGGGGEAAKQALYHFNHLFIYLFGGTVLTALMTFCVWVFRLPRAIAVNNNGLRFLYLEPSARVDQLLPWQDLVSINIESSSKDASAHAGSVVFKTAERTLKLKLENFKSPDEREKLLHAIERYAPKVTRDAEVMQVLAKPADHSYTELWLTALSAPPKRERLKPLMPGATMHHDQYKVVRELGSGGQGFAYLASNSDDGSVVLKEFILPIYVDIQSRRRALERFENEARLLSRLDHPQVVKLSSFFIEDHRAYLVLEHIDGNNLRELVAQRGPFTQEEVKGLHKQMQNILDYLHSLSPPLVHRDFTPDNLILDKDGKLKLIDFNVAQEMQDGTTGTVVGKQSYLPPEQFRGHAEPASDLYAMGATLYYLLTGKDPTPISTIDLSSEMSDIDPELNSLLKRLTELEPANRKNSATGF